MGRAYRKQVMEILDLLKKMQEGVQKAIHGQNIQVAGQLLTQMQDAAITLGTSIEAHMGEGSSTVKAVEEYCELIYQLYEAMGQQGEVEVMGADLCSQWKQIHCSAEGELSNRYEMVFLPYKVSMWDSLESVWRAADEDPNCDAYVIPIPYYDKNPDGTFRSEHYEGEEFPEDVPVMHYLEYAFESRHPDVIFIHNPYDDHNFVTSVHPYFYTTKLKEYAEKLIYIPYYISEEINPDSREAIEGKALMTLTSGVFNADMIFLQSENTKRLFVNILAENIQNIDRSYWENKIWGLGSPKLDRVKRVARNDARLPQNWHDLIYTESGVRKKVIFYNISISTLLKKPEMLNKIRDVLMFFKNNEDVALWWRPHPLYESTLASMRLDMLSEYQQIVDQYKKEGWGIFDNGVDLEWAIAETDAYYGDGSSVVQLYKEAGKPVMIQDVSVRTQQETEAADIPIWPSAFCVDGADIWFVHGKMNVLMRYNMIEDHTYVMGTIPKEKMFQESLYKGIYKWGTKIFMIPCWAREIAVYDIADRTFMKIPLREIELYAKKTLFNKIYVIDECLYCVPQYYKVFLKIHMGSLDIEYIDISKKINKSGISTHNVCLNDSIMVGNEIISVLAYTNLSLHYQPMTNTIYIQKIGGSERQFTNIAYLKDQLYLFDKKTNAIIRVQRGDYSIEEELGVVPYKGIKMRSNNSEFLMIDPTDDEGIQIINSEGKEVFNFDGQRSTYCNSLAPSYHSGIEGSNCDGTELSYYFNVSEYLIYQLDREKLKRKFSMTLGNDECCKWRNQYLHSIDSETKENDIYDLNVWKNNLREKKEMKNIMKQSSGEKILHTVLQQLFG